MELGIVPRSSNINSVAASFMTLKFITANVPLVSGCPLFLYSVMPKYDLPKFSYPSDGILSAIGNGL
jgi:hypothetical protein